MKSVVKHFHRNLVAYIALFVALGGTSYAAANLPANSVGARQLQTGAVDARKLNSKSIAASVRAWVNVQWRGSKKLTATATSNRVRVVATNQGESVKWAQRRFGRNCMASVTPQVNFTDPAEFNGYVTTQFDPTNRTGAILFLNGFGPDGSPRAQAVSVLIVCP